MKEQESSAPEMETMLRCFALRESSAGQRQRGLAAAQNAWQDTSVQPTISALRLIKALAACVAVILAVDICGRMALAPWRPHLASPPAGQDTLVTEDLHSLVPSARLLRRVVNGGSQAKKTGLQDYRNHLDRLLDETPQERPTRHTLPNRHQGQYVPARPVSRHG